VAVSLRDRGDGLELIVADDGTGLPDDLLAGGLENPTSLGLILVNSLVSQLKGELSATNESGAVFRIWMPND
jgi:two-component system, sensor histidine kinase PdtaS